MNPDGVRDYDLLIPATRRGARHRRPWPVARAAPGRGATPGGRRSRPRREGAPPADDRRVGPRSVTQVVASIGQGLVVLLGVGHDDDASAADALAERVARAADLPRRGGSDEPVAGRCPRRGAGGVAVHALRGHEPRSPTRVHRRGGARAGRAPLPAVRGRRSASTTSGSRRVASGPRWRWSS